MSETYWERLARLTEEAAQRVASDNMLYVRQVYREAKAEIKIKVDALYAQILDKGAESVTRTQLWQYSKYHALLDQIDLSVNTIRSAQDVTIERTIRKVFEDTLRTSLDTMVGKGRWSYPTRSVIDQYLATPWSGKRYSDRVWKNASKLGSDMRKHMEDMLVLGKSPSAVKKQLMADFNVSYEIADRLVITETSNAYNTAAMNSYRKAGVKQVRWVIGPAEGLCERCRTYSLENGGIYDIDDAPHIPVHPRCRCRWVAVVDIETRTKQIREQLLKDLPADTIVKPRYKSNPVHSGGIIYEDSPEAIRHAETYYTAVRKMRTDVKKIAKNTGMKRRDIAEVKAYIFEEEHSIYGHVRRFDPSFEMAQSWQRLIDGRNIQEQDIILLKHEMMELQLVKDGIPLEVAHTQASKAFDFAKYVRYTDIKE